MKLVRSEKFNNINCDFYKINDEIYMTARQLGEALGYLEPGKAINNIVHRYGYLKNPEFSGYIKLRTPRGLQNTRIFNEDGIYEITFFSETTAAIEFRTWVRKILKEIRKQSIKKDDYPKEQLCMVNSLIEINDIVGLLAKAQGKMEERMDSIDDRFNIINDKMERHIIINSRQANEIKSAIKFRVIDLLGGKYTESYINNSKLYYCAIHRDIKAILGVPSYMDILRKDYANIIRYIQNWLPKTSIGNVI